MWGCGYLFFLAFVSSLLVFTLFEIFPGLPRRTPVGAIHYYALGERYVADDALVFEPRRAGHHAEGSTRGDLYTDALGVDAQPIEFVMNYDREGFRLGSPPPHQLFVVGDSFIEVGETDDDTMAERLAAQTGLSARNLGRAWYGPNQYVELVRRYVPPTASGYVLFCLFGGNDLRDIDEYRDWSNGGHYHHWRAPDQSFLRRYVTVMKESWALARRSVKKRLARSSTERTAARRPVATGESERAIHPQAAEVDLGGEAPAILSFNYRPATRSAEHLQRTASWRTLAALLAEFRDLAARRGVEPIVVYVPMKLEVYASLVGPRVGRGVRQMIEETRLFADAAPTALATICADLELPLIDLLPEFRSRASRGELLFYPFDTHWNSHARQVAAERIAMFLAGEVHE